MVATRDANAQEAAVVVKAGDADATRAAVVRVRRAQQLAHLARSARWTTGRQRAHEPGVDGQAGVVHAECKGRTRVPNNLQHHERGGRARAKHWLDNDVAVHDEYGNARGD
eukprot:scaffold137882_cov72-Phaeocystis_antarctica.AAC.3